MSNPKYSIIIPALNVESIIGNALESILSQSFKDFELLIVDGLSLDRTVDIAKSFLDPRIIINSSKDSGVYDAMNKGLLAARGEWIMFLGSDDRLYNSEVLADMSKEMQQSRAKVFYGNVKVVGDAGWAEDGAVYDGYFDVKKILDHNICHQGIFYHRDAIAACGQFNLKYRICADYDYNLRAFSKVTFHYSDRIIAYFNGGGLSKVLKDEPFFEDLSDNIMSYFKWQLYRNEFINRRMTVRNCAFGTASPKFGIFERIWFAVIYLVLQLKSYFISDNTYSIN